MATGYAKSTGRLGICTGDVRSGRHPSVNELYDAKLDHVPVLAIPACGSRRCSAPAPGRKSRSRSSSWTLPNTTR